MKRKYADMQLHPDLRDMQQTCRMVGKASELGYSLIAITLPPNFPQEKTKQLKQTCKETGVDFASRADLKPKTSEELLSNLRMVRRRFEVVSVICETKNVARQAAKDRRVDLLNFPSIDFRQRFFDKPEAELASNSLAAFEITIKPLLTFEGKTRIRLLSSLRKETAIAQDFHIPIIISSGASDELLMRKPRELAALASLFALDQASSISAVSKNPLTIIKRNREKLSPKFVAPGIRVIREGKDC